MYPKYIKPIIDVLASMMILLILSPIFILIIIILSVAFKGSPFFTQIRPGKNARFFKIIKFKTMNNNLDQSGRLLPDKDRLTSLGRFIRSLSLDELPQLINVLKGDMSLIGPRPLMPQYLLLYSHEQAKRHKIKPGITGWAQVNGRNAISWEQKFKYDVWYVNNLSLLIDIKIIFLSVKKIIKKEGIYKEYSIESMEAFNGKN